MYAQTGNPAYGYGQLNSYAATTPSRSGSGAAAGGKTILILAGLMGLAVLIGMALGLGLGIGAAGLTNSLQLINVTNATQ